LCLLAFLMSFGPWGMFGVSQRSQAGRLRALLTKNEILVDGKVLKEHGKVSQEDAREISSIVSYLSRIHGYDVIQPWFVDKLTRHLSPSDVLDRIGVSYVDYRSAAGMMFSIDPKRPVDIAGYDRLLGQQFLAENQNKNAYRFEGDGVSCAVSDSLDRMTVMIGDRQTGFDSVEIDIGAFADKLLREYGDAGSHVAGSMTPEAMALEAEQNGRKVKLFFRHLHLLRRNGKVTISSFTADIAYTERLGGGPAKGYFEKRME
jgi:hypothetical protein